MPLRSDTYFGTKGGDDEWTPDEESPSLKSTQQSIIEKKRKQPPRKVTACKIARKTPPATPTTPEDNKEQAEPPRYPVAKLKSTYRRNAYTQLERSRDLALLIHLGFSESFANLLVDQWINSPNHTLGLPGRSGTHEWYLSAKGRVASSPIGWTHEVGNNEFLFFFRSFRGDWEVNITISKLTGAGKVVSAAERPHSGKPGFCVRAAPFVYSVLDNLFAEFLQKHDRAVVRRLGHIGDGSDGSDSDSTCDTVETSGSGSVGDVATRNAKKAGVDSGDRKPSARVFYDNI